jgi:hypothetical protein
MNDNTLFFVVMLNVFPRGTQISLQYDLKGSTAGRSVAPQGRNKGVALKDLDFQEMKKALLLEEETQQQLFRQINADAAFLQTEGLNDYSFLLGIANSAPTTIASCPATRQFYKGIPALDQKEVYFCGIIDILTAYEGVKVIEHAAKSLYQTNFSCIPPFDYAKRFVEYLDSVLLTKHVQRLYLASSQVWTSFASISTATGRPIPHSTMDAIHTSAASAPSSLRCVSPVPTSVLNNTNVLQQQPFRINQAELARAFNFAADRAEMLQQLQANEPPLPLDAVFQDSISSEVVVPIIQVSHHPPEIICATEIDSLLDVDARGAIHNVSKAANPQDEMICSIVQDGTVVSSSSGIRTPSVVYV